jgi:hypothetical protein
MLFNENDRLSNVPLLPSRWTSGELFLFIQFILKFAHGFLFSFQRFFFINVKFFSDSFNACLLSIVMMLLCLNLMIKNTKVAINPATIRKNNVLKTFFKLKSNSEILSFQILNQKQPFLRQLI